MTNSLLDLIGDGGYILYVRHGEATVGKDGPNLDFNDCYTQRNLSEWGREQAVYYGQIFRDLQVPIDYPVVTSPFCRAIETAKLAFGSPNVQVDPFWIQVYRLGRNISDVERRRILDALQMQLEVIPPKGENKVIIAHGFPEGIGLGRITEMETVIIRPKGQGNGYEVVAKIPFWELLNVDKW